MSRETHHPNQATAAPVRATAGSPRPRRIPRSTMPGRHASAAIAGEGDRSERVVASA